ncbi:MAG TPA: hypothetical protein VGG09_08050 [Acidimicrobiales bacterium]
MPPPPAPLVLPSMSVELTVTVPFVVDSSSSRPPPSDPEVLLAKVTAVRVVDGALRTSMPPPPAPVFPSTATCNRVSVPSVAMPPPFCVAGPLLSLLDVLPF